MNWSPPVSKSCGAERRNRCDRGEIAFEDAQGDEWIVSASQDYTLRYWRMSQRGPVDRIRLESPIVDLAVPTDGSFIGVSSVKNAVNSPGDDRDTARGVLKWISTQSGEVIGTYSTGDQVPRRSGGK